MLYPEGQGICLFPGLRFSRKMATIASQHRYPGSHFPQNSPQVSPPCLSSGNSSLYCIPLPTPWESGNENLVYQPLKKVALSPGGSALLLLEALQLVAVPGSYCLLKFIWVGEPCLESRPLFSLGELSSPLASGS